MSAGGRVRNAGEDAAWFAREHVAWPVEDGVEGLGGSRGLIAIFGGGGLALAGIIAALVIASSGGSGGGGTTEASVAVAPAPAPSAALASAPKPKQPRSTAPTLHGAPPDFSSTKGAKVGVGNAKSLPTQTKTTTDEAPVPRDTASASDTSAATAKIGSTSSQESAVDANTAVEGNELLSGPPAPQAAKRVAHNFAEAFVLYETGRTDADVRTAFDRTTTKQLSKSLLHRPPRQPADVKVPQAKVVNVVAGPSEAGLFSVSVSLLRVGVTSELRLEMQQGPDKKWQVTNVLG